MNETITFGQAVRERRHSVGLTQSELAGRVGCAAITIRKIEADDLRPSRQIAELLALALKVPEEEQLAFIQLARRKRKASPLPTPTPSTQEIGLEDLSGRAVKGFQLGEKIGSGGFGVVYRAVQPSVSRDVAVKIILPRFANHPEFIRRFEAEAQTIAHLEHPHIVPLYDYWRQPSAAYLIMRLLKGGSLAGCLKDGALPLGQVDQMVRQIGLGLHAAHRQGVIHRDIKPANILLDEDQNAYLADFGIAKNLQPGNGLTATGEQPIIGSPAYLSPEQILAEPVGPQSDIYCLGIILYEMLTGQKPFPGPTPVAYIQQHLNEELPSIQENNPELPAALDEVIRQATAKNAADRFKDTAALLAALDTALAAADGVRRPSEKDVLPVPVVLEQWAELENPYKGLRAFTEGDADNFFGRNALIQEIFSQLSADSDLARFLAVVGPSGSGKSSAVKAGLVPALRRGGLPGSENWFVVDLVPGAHPWEELEAALLRVAVNPPESLLGQLQEGNRGLLRAVNRSLPDDGQTELVLVIDQFEELFTLVDDEETRDLFLNSLVSAVLDERSRMRVVITLRADFYDRPLGYVDFGDMLRQRTVSVLPMTPDELEKAIVRPAAQIGVELESGLLARIIGEVADQPGALPLLQYALTELFERRQGSLMTQEAYEASGGVTGALGGRAEELHSGLDDAGRLAVRQLFLRLITLGEGVEDTRRRVRLSELQALDFAGESGQDLTAEMIEIFGRSRLLTFDHDPVTREPTVEVAHEALLREWDRLRTWLEESRDDVRLQRLLAASAAEWQESGQDPGFLLRGSRLDQFENWASETDLVLTAAEHSYLQASLAERRAREAAEAERQTKEEDLERRSRNRLRALVGVLSVAALIAIVLTIFAISQQRAAEENEALAVQGQATATVAQGEALFLAGTAEAERIRAEEESHARATAQAQAEADRLLAEAQRRLAEEQEAAADEQKTIAEEQTSLSRSRELAIQSQVQLGRDPDLSLLLAIESMKAAETSQARSALHQAVLDHRLVRTMSVQDEVVDLTGIAFSPDSQVIATTGFDGVNRIWDTDSGELLRSWVGHDDIAFHVSWSSDGSKLVTSGFDGKVRVWDPESGQELFSADGYLGDIDDNWAVAFSPDGSQLVSPSAEGYAKVWDLESGNELLTLTDSDGVIRGSTFNPDGSLIATMGSSLLVKIWDAATGDLLLTLPNTIEWAWVLEFSPAGTYLVATDDFSAVRVWNIPVLLETYPDSGATPLEGSELYSLAGHRNNVVDTAFSPDERFLYTGGQDGMVKMWELATGEERLSLISMAGAVNGVEVSQECSGPPEIPMEWCGRYVISSHGDSTLRFWDVSPLGNQELAIYPPGNSKFNSDGSKVMIYEYDCFESDETGYRVTCGSAWNLPPESSWVDISDLEIDYSKDSFEIPTHTVGASVDRAYWLNKDRSIMAAIFSDKTIFLHDAETGELLATLSMENHPEVPETIAFSPDNQLIASGDQTGTVIIWNLATGEEIRIIEAHDAFLDTIAFSLDNELVLTGAFNGEAKLWEIETGEEVMSLIGHTGWVRSAEFSPDGQTVATGSRDTSVRVWDIESGQELQNLVGHSSSVIVLDYSADGSTLTSGGVGDRVNVWDTATGELVLSLEGPHGQNLWLEDISSDDNLMLVDSWNGMTEYDYVLFMQEEPLFDLAISKLTRWFSEDECRQYLHLDECPPPPEGFREH